MANVTLPSVPYPSFPRSESNRPDYAPGEQELSEQFFAPLLKLLCFIYDFFFGVRPNLKATRVTVFTEQDLTVLQAWRPPSWYPDQIKLKYYREIIKDYKNLLINWGAAETKSSYALCYSRFSNALEKDKENQECLDALKEKIAHWIVENQPLYIGIPYEDRKEARPTLSSDFVLACSRFETPIKITVLHINGPIVIEDAEKITSIIKAIDTLTELHLTVQKNAAQYFLHELPFILNNRKLTTLSLRNLNKGSTFVVYDSVWDKLCKEQKCTITFYNIPAMPEHFSSAKLIFQLE